MDAKRLIDVLAMVDEDHFAVIESGCAEIYSKKRFFSTPQPKSENVKALGGSCLPGAGHERNEE